MYNISTTSLSDPITKAMVSLWISAVPYTDHMVLDVRVFFWQYFPTNEVISEKMTVSVILQDIWTGIG